MGIKSKFQFPRIPRIVTLLLLVTGASYVVSLYMRSPKIDENFRSYSEFLRQVENNEVAQVVIGNTEIKYWLKSTGYTSNPATELFQTSNKSNNPLHFSEKPPLGTETDSTSQNQLGEELFTPRVDDPELLKTLQNKKIVFTGALPSPNAFWYTILSWVVPSLILVGAMYFLLNRDDAQTRRSLAFTKSKAKVYVEGESARITFADVAGAEEAKAELVEIVEFLKNPDRFNQIGARIPKGVLLVGPPGTGKTLMAKAVAGEAGVPFFSISASEFVELFVGTGAARVRDLFAEAKKQVSCIIFIDELDAIGKSRSSGNFSSGSNDEREQTLNQLLTEMDGFAAGEATVIILAATNRPETLDKALLRPGRFDRQVLVDRPDLAGRLAILEIYSRKVKLDLAVDLKAIATQTSGFAGADLANLVNEAALLAARNQRESVTQQDFKEAIERVIGGLERKSRVLGEQEKKVVAYHEVGHALVGAVMSGGNKVEKISIVPRGLATLGYALSTPTEERFLTSEVEYYAKIAKLLGGRAAEEIIFGNVTDGAYDDLQRATYLAEQMVTALGMSKVVGLVSYESGQQANFLGNGNGNSRRNVSEETARAIDEEIKQIVESGHQQALAILNHNRELLEAIAQQLLKTEVIEGEELHNLLNQVQPVKL